MKHVVPRTRAPMPLLLDEDLHYRLMRCLFGEGYQRWNFRRMLMQMPPLFGVWHPYKQVTVQVWRAFRSYVVHFLHGSVDVGSRWAKKVPLRAVETQFACLLQRRPDTANRSSGGGCGCVPLHEHTESKRA